MIEFKIDCGGVKSSKNLHTEIKNKLMFPDFYGKNFSALDDSLTEFFTDYIDHTKPQIKEHIVFNFVGYEPALSAIGEEDFQVFMSCFEDAIAYWKGRVVAEVRLVR